MGFRSTHTVYRKQPGHYEEGTWVDGGMVQDTLQASVQPAGSNSYARMQTALPGQSISALFDVYADVELNPVRFDGQTLVKADQMDYLGERYHVVAAMPWQNGVINHWHMIVARLPNVSA